MFFYELNVLALRMRLGEGRNAGLCALLWFGVKVFKKEDTKSIVKVNSNQKFRKINVHFSLIVCAWILKN